VGNARAGRGDLLTCLLIAGLAALFALIANDRGRRSAHSLPPYGLLRSALYRKLCGGAPDEVFAMLFTTAALLPLCLLVTRAGNRGCAWSKNTGFRPRLLASRAYASLLIGLCTLFRPESPLLLLAAWLVLGAILIRQHERDRWLKTMVLMAALCAVPLVPWTIRNAVTLHEFQPLPQKFQSSGRVGSLRLHELGKNVALSLRDVYLVPWKLNEETIDVNDIHHAPSTRPLKKSASQ